MRMSLQVPINSNLDPASRFVTSRGLMRLRFTATYAEIFGLSTTQQTILTSNNSGEFMRIVQGFVHINEIQFFDNVVRPRGTMRLFGHGSVRMYSRDFFKRYLVIPVDSCVSFKGINQIHIRYYFIGYLGWIYCLTR